MTIRTIIELLMDARRRVEDDRSNAGMRLHANKLNKALATMQEATWGRA